MIKKKSKLKLAQEEAEWSIEKTNEKICELGKHASQLYNAANTLQKLFEDIRNVPSEKLLEYEKLKTICLNWKQQAEKIESDYKKAGVVLLGPAAAMGIATTFGIASTGTAISTLSGAAATNMALAWFGGGALATGGARMMVGNVFRVIGGPVCWAIILGSGILLWREKNRLEDIFTLISKRDVKSCELAIVEINERISRIIDETKKLNYSIERTSEFGLDYNLMTEAQQYELGSYVNLMNSSTQLLINPIIGLMPNYSIGELKEYAAFSKKKVYVNEIMLIVSLANILYKIDLDEKDKLLLWKSFKGNKEFLSSIKTAKKDFKFPIMETISDALKYKYSVEKD